MKITERRVVYSTWYETEYSKNGWESHGWHFDNGEYILDDSWSMVTHLRIDKFGNPLIGLAEKETEI